MTWGQERTWRRSMRRRLAGGVWLAGWIGVLYAVAAPWRHLGGLESERLRWLEAFVLMIGLVVGFTLGRFGRDAVLDGRARSHVHLLRFVLYPPAVLAAAGLVVLTLLGERGPAGVVVSALLAYWAGLDLSFGAVPLMEGKSYRLTGPLEPEPADDRTQRRGWEPPWDRLG